MKILALYNPLQGSKYHRVKLMLSHLNVIYLDKITEHGQELLTGVDVLWVHYSCSVPAAILSEWKREYGFKFILDLDDTWDIPTNHPEYKGLQSAVKNSKDLAILADTVTVSTDRLGEVVRKYNENVVVIPNILPSDGQFYRRDVVSREKKNIALIGSYTHLENWNLIKGYLYKYAIQHNLYVVLDTKARDKFRVAGIHYLDPLPPDEYMNLYRNFDIVLCPLISNSLNLNRSDLKLRECHSAGCLPIVSDLYESDLKEFVPIVKNDKHWPKIIDETIKNYDTLLSKFLTYQAPDFEVRRNLVDQVLSMDRKTISFDDCYFHTIVYKEGQRQDFEPYFNRVNSIEGKSYLFEYNPMFELATRYKGDHKWFGVFSHKFLHKTGINKEKLRWILNQHENNSNLIISFCPNLRQPYLSFTESVHPGFLKVFRSLCQKMNVPIKEPPVAIYGSFFVMHPKLYLSLTSFLQECLDVIGEYDTNKPEFKDSLYKGLSKKDLKEYTGLDYYPMIVFLLERIVGQWAMKKGLKMINYSVI